jgi:glycine cleavage system transcriptional repressor
MTCLAREFAIMLAFSSPATLTESILRKALEPLAKRRGLVVHLTPLSPREATRPKKAGPSYLISVYGADRPGIVFRVSEALAASKVNITNVETRRSSPSGRRAALYLMFLEVELPPHLRVERLEQRLRWLGKRLGVEVSLRSTEAEVL